MGTPDETPASPSRAPALIVGAFVVAVLVVVAILKVGTSSREPVAWTIVESADEGHTLRIAPLIALSACTSAPKVDLRKSNANRVDLAVTAEVDDCGPDVDDGARVPKLVEVKLAQPLRGQQITGPKLEPPSKWRGARAVDTVPSVVGFRFPDAQAILASRTLEARVGTGPTGDATEVTQQAPAAGTPKSAEGAVVTLRTVPR